MKNNTNKIFAQRKEILFAPDVVIDGYKLPGGEYRVSVTGASTIVGFSRQWLSQVHTRGGKTWRALQGEGFTGSHLEVRLTRNDLSGASIVKTISLDDFAAVIFYAASCGKKQSKARDTLARVYPARVSQKIRSMSNKAGR